MRAMAPVMWTRAAVLTALAVTLCIPLWTVEYPPMTDLPQHVHLTAVVRDLLLGRASAYALRPLNVGYLLWYAVCAFLSLAVGPLAAVKLLVSGALIATPLSVASLSRALGRTMIPGFVALGLTWNAMLYLGFAQFLAALPVGLFAMSRAVRATTVDRRRSDVAAAGALSALGFALHPIIALPYLGTVALGMRRATLRTSAVLSAPLVAAATAWAAWSPVGRAQIAALGNDHVSESFSRPARRWRRFLNGSPISSEALRTYGASSHGCWSFSQGRHCGRSAPRRLGFTLFACGVVALYFVAPMSQDWVWPIAPRFLLLGALLLTVVWPVPERGRLAGVWMAAHAALAILAATQVAGAFRDSERENGNFAVAIECVPSGSTFAIWPKTTSSSHVRFWPYTHFGGYVYGERGGAWAFSFASHPSAPVRWRREPPPVPSNGFRTGRQDPADALRGFEVVLVRGDEPRITEDARFEQLCGGTPWSVWRIGSDEH